jgi:cytochrome c oxidase subunit II
MKDFLAQYMPPDYSAHGAELDKLNANVHLLMLVLFIGWGLLFAFMLFRFRKSKHPRASYHGTKSHLSSYAEFGILVVEVVLLVVFSIPLWARWANSDGEKDALTIRVVAEQFAWNIHYPGADGVFGRTNVKLVSSSNPLGLDVTDPNAKDDVATMNQLHLQVGRPVVIQITSKDVIHSFSLPYMRVKQDAVPGMQIPIHFTPVKTTAGKETWDIACAQLCGLGHYKMKGSYQVHSKADFDKWIAAETPVATNISG